MVNGKAAGAPFLIGLYGCIVKPLGMLGLRTLIARLDMRHDLSFAPRIGARSGWDFEVKTAKNFTVEPPELQFCFRRRKLRSRLVVDSMPSAKS